jgi:hypothetical protein
MGRSNVATGRIAEVRYRAGQDYFFSLHSHQFWCPVELVHWFTTDRYCDESRNSGIGPEVDFLGNELLRQLHDNN